MTSTNRTAGSSPRRLVPDDIAAANAAYIASLKLPPLTPGQAARIRGIVASAEERIAADAAEAAA